MLRTYPEGETRLVDFFGPERVFWHIIPCPSNSRNRDCRKTIPPARHRCGRRVVARSERREDVTDADDEVSGLRGVDFDHRRRCWKASPLHLPECPNTRLVLAWTYNGLKDAR